MIGIGFAQMRGILCYGAAVASGIQENFLMTMVWASSMGQMARAARIPIARGFAGFTSVLAITAFLVLPGMSLLMVAVDGCFFPVQHHALNVAMMYAFDGILLLDNVIFLCEPPGKGWRNARFWEDIILRRWFGVAIAGMGLGGTFYWLGVNGVWAWAIEQDHQARLHFVGLVLAAPAAGLYAIVGRVFLWAKTLDREERGGASTMVFAVTLLVWLFSFCLSSLKVHDVIGWAELGMVQG